MSPKSKRLITNLHGWVGALAAMFILLVSVSGGLIAFSAQLMHAETGAMPHNVGPSPNFPDLTQHVEDAKTYAGETFIPLGFLGPDAEIATPVSMVWGLSDSPEKGGESQIITLDPETGETLGTFLLDRTFTHELIEFHANLLAGPLGGVIVAIVGLVMAGLSIVGFVLARPITRKPRGRPARRWHRTVGVWATLPVMVWGLSGAYWSQPDWARPFQPYPDDLSLESQEKLGQDCGQPTTIGQAMDLAINQIDSSRLREAEFAAPWQPYHMFVFASETNNNARSGDVRVLVSSMCSDVVILQNETKAGAIGSWLITLHTGEFLGPLRAPFILLLGLLLSFLTVTGLITWWKRYIKV